MFETLYNPWEFAFRSWLKWQRGSYPEPAENKTGLFDDREKSLQLPQREAALLHQYNLEFFKTHGSRLRYLETLTYLEYLEQLLPDNALCATDFCWLDVGAKNWSYVEALYRFIERSGTQFTLDGIELDAYRVYANLYSRTDYAHAFTRNLPHARYIAGDVLTHEGAYDVVSCFLPFVFKRPSRRWGLPDRHFNPPAFLAQLVNLLKPDGRLIIVNQGEAEAEEQARLLDDLKMDTLAITSLGRLPGSFLPYQYPRYGWRICKQPVSLPIQSVSYTECPGYSNQRALSAGASASIS